MACERNDEPMTDTKPKLGRSLQAEEVTLEEIRELTQRFDEAAPLFDDDMVDGAEYDIVVVDGDLHVDGDLRTFDHGLMGLVVRGSLTVEGLYEDTDDPACGVFVLGDMKAQRVITTGSLGVAGSLTVTEALIGFYNDYGAMIGKDVMTPLFHPENHYFDIRGNLEAKAVVGRGAQFRVPAALKARVEGLVPKNLRELLVDEVLRGEADDEIELDDSKLRARVAKGLPVLR